MLELGLVHPVAPVFNENHKSVTFVRNLSCIFCTQYHTACFGYTAIIRCIIYIYILLILFDFTDFSI
jgi:hypothetical protein